MSRRPPRSVKEARLTGERRVELADGTRFEADRICLTTGSQATTPPIEGIEELGWWDSRDAIWCGDLPDSLLILGTGPIGIEFAQIYARFGSEVTMVELFDRILYVEDPDSSAAVRPAFEDGGSVSGQHLLVATGRRPVFDVHDLKAAGVELDDAGKPILGDTMRTTNGDIWCGGDATGELLFTHVGGYEAGLIIADIKGKPRKKDYRVVPRVTYCEPEVASVGLA